MENLAVITTKFVIENNSPILSVFRDEEGDWQFFGFEEVEEQDARVVSLEEILKIDPSIQEILWLSNGMTAHRENAQVEWKTLV